MVDGVVCCERICSAFSLHPAWVRNFPATSPRLIVGALCLALAKYISSPELLIIGRLIIGVECGLYTGLCPMYLSEVSPKRIRGMLGSLSGLSAYTGLMLAEIISTPALLGTGELWPLLMVFAAIPSVTQFFLLQFCFESPRFLLMNRNDEEGARVALVALRQRSDVDDEINEMKQEAEHLKGEVHITIRELFTQSVFRSVLRSDDLLDTRLIEFSWYLVCPLPWRLLFIFPCVSVASMPSCTIPLPCSNMRTSVRLVPTRRLASV